MLCFYDLGEVQVILFHAVSKNFRNEVVPPSSEKETCVVQLSCSVFPVCVSSVNLARTPQKPIILTQIEPDRFCGV